ncbi:hypothetical protein SM124_10775 [Bacillus sp. 31A1R]|uniref:Uncharacterized protein n=1 Tax=Robertmurraya mangrovi TaxID=3098077 RepID=A0ABU5IYP1_9BACI|nr:hypothetical protein [Bacillus sp. 31A1R]MDZ5472231.1 hypothetical protein [Bacillus sp. 31A1R]
MNIQLEQIIGSTPFPGNGRMTGSYFCENKELISITSIFDLYGWEVKNIGNGSSSSVLLKHRVTINQVDTGKRIATLDTKYEINEVSFHPSKPIVAIATGSYDGGYLYEGELLIWNYETNTTNRVFEENREVVSARFDDHGDTIVFTLSPRDDQEKREVGLYYIHKTNHIHRTIKLSKLPLVATREFKIQPRTMQRNKMIKEETIARLKELQPNYEFRTNIWAVKSLSETEILSSGECHFLEKWKDGQRECAHTLYARGVQILFSSDEKTIFVNTEAVKLHPEFKFEVPDYYLISFDTKTLQPLHQTSLQRPTVVTMNKENNVLLKSVYDSTFGRDKDILMNGDHTILQEWDANKPIGYLRANGKSHFYFLTSEKKRGNTSYQIWELDSVTFEQKELVTVTVPPQIQNREKAELFLRVDESFLLEDEDGPAFIIAAKVYPLGGSIEDCHYISRMDSFNGENLWVTRVTGQILSMCEVKAYNLIIFSTDDGQLGILSSKTGELIDLISVEIEGSNTMVLSIDVRDNKIVAGTIDGHILCYQIRN